MTQTPYVRKWTDDDLRDAVASEESWKAVARHIGLAPSGYQRLRRRARALGLDASHFKGKRRWSDYDLREAAASSGSWSELLERLDVSDTSETRLCIKGHASRLGMDLSRLNDRLRMTTSDADVLHGHPSLSKLRVAGEALATSWFELRGCQVALPREPCRYDLLVTVPNRGVQRVQVKTSTRRRTHDDWNVGIGRRHYVGDKSVGVVPYDPDTVDFFFVVVSDGGIYFIPSGAVGGMININVRAYAAYWVGDASSLMADARP